MMLFQESRFMCLGLLTISTKKKKKKKNLKKKISKMLDQKLYNIRTLIPTTKGYINIYI